MMIIKLDEVEFENDFYNVDLPDGSVLTINRIEEDIPSEEGSVPVSAINLQVTVFDEDENETYIHCPCAIGLGNDILILKTDYSEYEGQVLTSGNMKYCTIEVYE